MDTIRTKRNNEILYTIEQASEITKLFPNTLIMNLTTHGFGESTELNEFTFYKPFEEYYGVSDKLSKGETIRRGVMLTMKTIRLISDFDLWIEDVAVRHALWQVRKKKEMRCKDDDVLEFTSKHTYPLAEKYIDKLPEWYAYRDSKLR